MKSYRDMAKELGTSEKTVATIRKGITDTYDSFNGTTYGFKGHYHGAAINVSASHVSTVIARVVGRMHEVDATKTEK